MELPCRFFVSFSSRDLKYVREIMAALKGQELDFWDYSDIAESIEVGENIDERLSREIEVCTHMVIVISKHSMDARIGRFCRFELEYALNRNIPGAPHFIPVIIDLPDQTGFLEMARMTLRRVVPGPVKPHKQLKLKFPYNIFQNDFCLELDASPESIVKFAFKVCQTIDKVYIPPIVAHANLPFWKLFRKEVMEMAHSNKVHTDIMMTLGEFSEFYRRADMQSALLRIDNFITTCAIKIPNYKPFYPRIVKAVCETELGMFGEAIKSYETAKTIHPENQDVIGGIGTVYFKSRQYQQAAACFEQIIKNNATEDITNARINLIITKQAMDKPVTIEEDRFLFSVDTNLYPDDLKTAILNAQGIQYKIKRDYAALEKHCKSVISKNLHDGITINLLQGSYFSRGMKDDTDKGLPGSKH